jgi:hypothetical protein
MWLKVSSHNKAWINLNLGEFYQQSITNNELVHVVKKILSPLNKWSEGKIFLLSLRISIFRKEV